MEIEQLYEIHKAYLLGGERIHLDRRPAPRRHGESRLRASEIGRCQIRSSYRRLEFPQTHPETEMDYNRAQIMEEGVRVAEIWQEALRVGFGDNFDYEIELGNNEICGQADGVITENGTRIPIELKRTEYRQLNNAHVSQLLVYILLLDAPYGFLVYQHRDSVQIYKIERNDNLVAELIAAHNQWLIDVGSMAGNQGYIYGQCCKEKEEDTLPTVVGRANNGYVKGDVKPGTITVSCPFFEHCHPGMAAYKYRVTQDEEGNYQANEA